MAVGLSLTYLEELQLGRLTSEQFLVIGLETATILEWNITHTSQAGFIARTKSSIGSAGEEIRMKIEGYKVLLKSVSTENQMNDEGKNKTNLESFITLFYLLKDTYTEEELSQKFEEIKPNLVPPEEDLLIKPPETTKEIAKDFLSLFKPKRGYFITPLLLNLTIAVFILMALNGVNIISPDSASLLRWGANFKPLTLGGEWWRLITCCFIHIGLVHLLMNMYALLYIGVLLEPYLGKARFIAAYLLSGIIASMTSLYWHDFTISAGASGAIFGMYGVFLAMLTTNLIEKTSRKTMLLSIVFFVGYSLLNGLKGGIDNAAHLGGLVGGLIIGYAYYPSLVNAKAPTLKYLTIGLLTLFVFFLYLLFTEIHLMI